VRRPIPVGAALMYPTFFSSVFTVLGVGFGVWGLGFGVWGYVECSVYASFFTQASCPLSLRVSVSQSELLE
jgi:hypothetical protein